MDFNKLGLVVLSLMFMFMLIAPVSAFEFDNVKSYDPITREVTIINAFGLGDDIGKARLNTPLNVKVAPGYQKVAEFDLWAYEDYSDALKQFTFTDMKKKEKINREFDLKYLTYEEILIKDYKTECSKEESKNGTIYNNCKNVLSGSHLEEVEVWNKITPADLKKNEKVTIGIFTNVKMGDYVDWIPTIYGVEVKEWATWEGDIKVDLLSYYKLDNTTGDVIDIHGGIDGTNSGADRGVSGKINNAFDFGGEVAQDYFSFTQQDLTNFTINLWLNPDSAFGVPWGHICADSDSSPEDRIYISTATTILLMINDAQYLFPVTSHIGVWKMYTITRDGTNASLYLNGTYISSQVVSTNTFSIDSFAKKLGASSVDYYDGKMDEILISERALTQEEITFLYNDFEGLTYDDDGFILPTITLNSPTSANYTTNQNLQINFTASDDIQLSDVKLYVNDILNQTNSSGINNTDYIFDLELSDGEYIIYGKATDNNSGSTNSSNITIFIDTISPVINLTDPEDVIIWEEGLNLTLNWTAIDIHLESCWYNYNGTNISVTCGDNTTDFSYDGKNNITFYVNDTFGNLASAVSSWGSYLTLNNITYDSSIYETDNTTLSANISYDILDLSVSGILEYNGVNYTTIKSVESDGAYFSKSFDIPSGRVGETNNFSWYFVITDGYNGTTSLGEYNQTIIETYLGYCNATYSAVGLNFTFWDEDAGTAINASANPVTFEGTYTYWIGSGTDTKNFSISDFNVTNSSYFICISPNSSIKTNLALSYDATGYSANTYHLAEASITNNTSDVSLWLLSDTIGRKFYITAFYGISSLNGATITATKYFDGEGVYKTTGIGLTDSSGKFAMFLDPDKSYKFFAVSDGESLGVVEKGAFCEVEPCEMAIQFFESSSSLFGGYNDIYAEDVVYSLYFNETTDLVNAVFSDTTGTANYFRFEVNRVSLNNTNLNICDQTLYTTSGAMVCNMSGLTGNYEATLVISRSPEKVIDFIQFIVGGLQDALGATGLIVSLLFLIVIVFSGLRNPVIAVALVPVALTCLKLVDLLPISWLWIASIAVLALLLIGRLKT